jgi:hypothetical protein
MFIQIPSFNPSKLCKCYDFCVKLDPLDDMRWENEKSFKMDENGTSWKRHIR